MGPRPRLVAETFYKLPNPRETWEISHTAPRGGFGPSQSGRSCLRSHHPMQNTPSVWCGFQSME